MWSGFARVLCVSLLAATTLAKPSRGRSSAATTTFAKLYGSLHPNTELDGNPEYGEHFEGDILVREDGESHAGSNPLNSVTDPDLYWPNGIIYYTILTEGYTPDQIVLIENGIADLVELTKVNGELCVQILPRQSERDYVFVENFSGCSSWMGRQGGIQRISLVDSCVTKHGTIMHEFLHAFGFYHEQSRYDRDDYITINWGNIQPGTQDNFAMASPEDIDLLGTAYDYGSVMHYGAYAFAVDESIPTIIPHDPNAEIGQRVTLSELDIERVQIYYGCLAAADSRFFKHLDPKWVPTRK